VVSVDQAGNKSPERLYRFNVDFAGEDAFWSLDEGSGTTAVDTSGNGNTLTIGASTTWIPGPFAVFELDPNDRALLFDSTDAVAETAEHVVATNKSFTVMAIVKLDSTQSVTATAVSQDGQYTSGFKLGHTNDAGACATSTDTCWSFSMYTADAPTSGDAVRATSPVPPVIGDWVHLTGVYDAAAGQLRLYTCVLGTPDNPGDAEPVVATVNHTSTWNSAESLRLGRGLHWGTVGDYWPGAIDDVRVFDEIVSVTTIRDICQGSA
jgi:hypothetical protein